MANGTEPAQQIVRAILEGNLAALKALHSEGARFSTTDASIAVATLRPEILDFLLAHGADPNFVKRKHEQLPLDAAILVKETGMVKALLAHGADPNHPDGNALVSAISVGSFEILKLLVEAGGDLFRKNEAGVTPLQVTQGGAAKKIREYVESVAKSRPGTLKPNEAAKLGAIEVIRSWLATSPDAKAVAHAAGVAAWAGHAELVALFLSNGVDPLARVQPNDLVRNWPNESLIFWAIHEGHTEVVAVLLQAGVSVGIRNSHSSTALLMAVMGGHSKIVKLLLDAGADPLETDSKGNNPLVVAKQRSLKQIAKQLEKAVAARPPQTASLIDAVQSGLLAEVRRHLDAGADLNVVDTSGQTPLQLALRQNHLPIVNLLLERGVRVDSENAAPLWEQVLHDRADPEIVTSLIAVGLPVNATIPRLNMTPIQFAVAACRSDPGPILERLLDAGADPDVIYTPVLSPEMRASYEQLKAVGSGLARTIGASSTLIQLATRHENRKAAAFLKARLDVPLDVYDFAMQGLKGLPEALERPAMAELAVEIGRRFGVRPQPWKKRKGVLSYRVKLLPLLKAANLGLDAAQEFLRTITADIPPRGGQLIFTKLVEGSEARTELLFFPSPDPNLVMAACGLNGTNHGLQTRDVVAWFAETAKAHPFRIIGCSFEFVDVRFETPLSDPRGLLDSIRTFCPDVEDFGDSAMKALAATGDCYFWWD
jgi:ankyrin repeat protein